MIHRERDQAIRRQAMFWMLREVGVPYPEIGELAGVSSSEARRSAARYAVVLHRRSMVTVDDGEPFMARLRAAGALLGSDRRDSRIADVATRFDPRSDATDASLPPECRLSPIPGPSRPRGR